MKVDLHMHSHCSDGVLSPTELMERAFAQGVQLLALTDHDTLAGVEEARERAQSLGMQLVSGIEFSTRWGSMGIHIVGLGLALERPALHATVAAQRRARAERNEEIGRRLEKIGVVNAYERARELAGEVEPGRPHFAELLVRDGKVVDSARAFKKYLGSGKLGDVRQQWPPMADIVAAIRAADGVAVLAHPAKYALTRTKLRALMSDFAAAGGQAVEIISGQQASGIAENLASLAREFELEASVGSDFHRPGHPWQELGCPGALPASVTPVWHRWASG